MSLTVFVTGATGQQGGTLARQLLKRGHRVLALTRTPGAPAAKALERAGASLVQGDFEKPDTLVSAMKGVDAVFLMGTPFTPGGPEAEVREGKAAVDAARQAGVKHLLYSSVGGAAKRTGIPHFDSKHEVEQAVRASGVPFTIVGPVWFMENFTGPMFGGTLPQGTLALALPPKRGLQMVALADLGAVYVRVLENRDRFLGRRFDFASDEVSGEQAVAHLSRAIGRPITYTEVPVAAVRQQSEDLARMYEWFNSEGYQSDLAALRREFPDVGWHSFETWTKEQDWSQLAPPPGAGTGVNSRPKAGR